MFRTRDRIPWLHSLVARGKMPLHVGATCACRTANIWSPRLDLTFRFRRRRNRPTAPRFRAKTTAGDQFNNASVKGKVVLFEFRTTWCKYCEAEAELVDDIAKEFSDKGLIVLAVDVLEPDQKVKKYLVEHPRSVPIVLTKDTNLAAMYNAQSYPIYVVIDRDGNIAAEPARDGRGERVTPDVESRRAGSE